MEQSESIGELAAAMAKFQQTLEPAQLDQEVTVQKKKGGTYTFKFASLGCVIKTLKKALKDTGLSYTQGVSSDPKGSYVTTQIMHKSGQWTRDKLFIPVDSQSPQAVGSAIAYARRYGLGAAFGTTVSSDDDAGAAGDNPVQTMKEKTEEFRRLTAHDPADEIVQKLKALGVTDFCDLSEPVADAVLTKIKLSKAGKEPEVDVDLG